MKLPDSRKLMSDAKRAVQSPAAEGRKKRSKGSAELAAEAKKRIDKKKSR